MPRPAAPQLPLLLPFYTLPACRKDDKKSLSPAAQAALAEDDYEATPEDLPFGRVPAWAAQQAQRAQQAQQHKGEAAPSLRLQPFGQAAAQA